MLRRVIHGAEHFLTSLYVRDAFAVRDLEVPITNGDERRRHLILTGQSGSGKSSILQGVHRALGARSTASRGGAERWRTFDGASVAAEPQPVYRAEGSSSPRTPQPDGRPLVEVRGPSAAVDATNTLLAFMPAGRPLARPTGPARIDESRRSEGTAGLLRQYLVNLRMEQALAREDGDDRTARRIDERFQTLESHLRIVLGDDGAQLSFHRPSFDFRIVLGDGRVVGLHELADGVSSILFMWASLIIPAEAIRRAGSVDPPGWAVIDEPELHLHVSLQRMVLPLLVTMFPNVQLIVATHSPAVVASIPNATVFDLHSRKAISSHEFAGIRYGTILTQHFGVDTDFDLDTTQKLRRLKALFDSNPAPDSAEHAEMRALLHELSDRPHLLIAQVRKKLEFGDM
jgi:hypothetical protein